MQSVDRLLGRGRVPVSDGIDVADFSRFFVEKVDKVRRSTQDAPAPVFSDVKSSVELSTFESVTADDVISAVRRLPDKISAANPLPASILKLSLMSLLHSSPSCSIVLWLLVNFLLSSRRRSSPPVLKKPGLDVADPGSYRPISNLAVMSKLLERMVSAQLVRYLTTSSLLPPRQSGCRPRH